MTAQGGVRQDFLHVRTYNIAILTLSHPGLLSRVDLKRRYNLAKEILKEYHKELWTNKIAFYFDCKSFKFKTNPKDQATVPGCRVWRRKNEGLNLNCTGKGANIGSGGKTVHFVVAISYKNGVIACEQYERMNGKYFSDFIMRNLNFMFANSYNPESRLFLQDGNPSQNSVQVNKELVKYSASVFKIPPRSPDINPTQTGGGGGGGGGGNGPVAVYFVAYFENPLLVWPEIF